MRGRAQLLRFSIRVGGRGSLLRLSNWFDNWSMEEMPVKFVTGAMLCGVAYFFAVREFPNIARAALPARTQTLVFWGVAIGLRLIALPLVPGDDLYRYQWEGKIQRAGFNPYFHAPDDPKLEPIRAEFPNGRDQSSRFSRHLPARRRASLCGAERNFRSAFVL